MLRYIYTVFTLLSPQGLQFSNTIQKGELIRGDTLSEGEVLFFQSNFNALGARWPSG